MVSGIGRFPGGGECGGGGEDDGEEPGGHQHQHRHPQRVQEGRGGGRPGTQCLSSHISFFVRNHGIFF